MNTGEDSEDPDTGSSQEIRLGDAVKVVSGKIRVMGAVSDIEHRETEKGDDLKVIRVE